MDPFVGRQAATTTLVDALEGALAGRGCAVLLRGEAGIGKTRLAEEVARRARERGVRVAEGRCHDGEGALAYWPWVEVVRAAAGARCEAAPLGGGAMRDGEAARRTLDPAESRQARFRLFDEVTVFLRESAERQPLLVVLEDLHWADHASLLLLRFLACRLDGARALVVATWRDTDVDGAVSFYLGILAATLARHDAAVRHLEDALERHRRMGARPLLARTRHELGAVLLARGAPDDRERAAELLGRAVEDYAALGMPGYRERAAEIAGGTGEEHRSPPAARDGARADRGRAGGPRRVRGGLAREGDVWRLEWDGREARVRDLKGIHYVAALLRDPERELHVFDLLLEVEGGDPAGHAGPAYERGLSLASGADDLAGPDPKARASYRERRRVLLEEIEEAEAANDLGRLDRARREVEALESALADAFGFGGRGRRAGGAGERARKVVYNRLRSAVAAIERVHDQLGRHLAVCVRTGRTCVHRPDRPVSWTVEDDPPRGPGRAV